MPIKIRFAENNIINLEQVPSGWLWVDIADALLESGEITQPQAEKIYQHLDANMEAIGNLELDLAERTVVINQQTEPRGETSEGHGEEDVDEGDERYKVQNDSTEDAEPWIPPPTTVTPVEQVAITQRTYEMKAMCSKNRRNLLSTLISQHKPISNSNQSVSVSSNQRIHLILDDSGSMRGKDAIKELKKGVYAFLKIVNNAQVGIRWFNSKGLSIRTVGKQHYDCIDDGVAKYGNDHAQSLFDLVQKPRPQQAEIGDIVIMFTDGKPNGKGLNVIDAGKLVKGNGAKIITIGCGDSEPDFMRKIASTHADHHQVDDIDQLQSIFANVGQSLAQRNVSNTDIGESDAVAPARQVQQSAFDPNATTSSYSSSTSLGANEGFDYIQDFSCHFCRDEMRVICSSCSTTHCGGGVRSVGRRRLGSNPSHSSGAQEIECPNCGNVGKIDFSESVFGSASAGGTKKGG